MSEIETPAERGIEAVREYNLDGFDGITPIEADFVIEYIKTGDEKVAVQSVYGIKDEEIALQTGKSLLKKKKIKQAVTHQIKAAALRKLGTANTLIGNLVDIASFDPAVLFNEDGSLKPISEMPEGAMKFITKISYKDIKERVGASVETVGQTVDVSFVSQLKAIEMLMKNQGILEAAAKPTNTTINITQNINDIVAKTSTEELQSLINIGITVDKNDLSQTRHVKDFDFKDVIDAEIIEKEKNPYE